jgi:hypothetical protein
MSLDPRTRVPDSRWIAAEHAALLLPPTAFLLNLGVAYALVDPACVAGSRAALHLVHAVCLLLTIAGGVIARGLLRRSDGTPPDTQGSNRRFLAVTGLLSSGLFVLVILAQWLPEFYVDPCQ